MKTFLVGISCFLSSLTSFSQSISYEEAAVIFFAKQLLTDGRNPFYDGKIYFNGNINQLVSALPPSISERFPQDTILAKIYKKEMEEKYAGSYLLEEKNAFTIRIPYPIQYSKLKCPTKKNRYHLEVNQYKEVNGKYIIQLSLAIKDCKKEYFFYIIMDKNQQILDWFYDKNLN